MATIIIMIILIITIIITITVSMIILIITIIMSMLITIIIPRLFRLVCETIGTILLYIYKPSRDYIYIYELAGSIYKI